MKQLGNLAIVCAGRPEVLLQLHNEEVAVHVGAGPERAVMFARWDDDEGVSDIIRELNFGKYRVGRSCAAEDSSSARRKERAA